MRFLVLLAATAIMVTIGGARNLGGDSVARTAPFRIHTLFSVQCGNYFDWQTVALMHSFCKAGQPGPITRLLSCTKEQKETYTGRNLAPTLQVPSVSTDPKTGDWYLLINKPASVVYWLEHSKDAQNVDWVVILDADMIIRGPILPWELGAQKGRPIVSYNGYLIRYVNDLAKLYTKHPELCDKVGGLLAMRIDDLRALAPLWLSKTEEVWEDRPHWATNYTCDIYETWWISEIYGYLLAAAEVGLHHKIDANLMISPPYTPQECVEPLLLHYGLPSNVGKWSFSKHDHHEDEIVNDCGWLFHEPPYPREVEEMESDPNKRRALFRSIECMNTINEGLFLHHTTQRCPKPKWSKYSSLFWSKTFAKLYNSKQVNPTSRRMMQENMQKQNVGEAENLHPKIHTIFSTECSPYYDWQTVGLVHSFNLSGQPGDITRLLSCTDEALKEYKGHNLAPTHYVPSMSLHPLTGDWYPPINKPAAVVHWINHVKTDAEYVVILDSDMIMKGPITPWEFNAEKGRPVSAPNDYLIGCDNELAKAHTQNPDLCDKVGGVIIMHMMDLRRFSSLWLHKTEEVRADVGRWPKSISGDVYDSGWMSEMYGYSFAAAEMKMRHVISNQLLIFPGHIPVPGVKYRVYHYGLEFHVGNWSFDKAKYKHMDVIAKCWTKFSDPPDPSAFGPSDYDSLHRDLLSIDCVNSLNEALCRHYERIKCPDPKSMSSSKSRSTQKTHDDHSLPSTDRRVTSEITASRKSENVNKFEGEGYKPELKDETQKLSLPFSSMRFWMISLSALSILGFAAVVVTVIRRHRRQRNRIKAHKTKRRALNSGFQDRTGDS